jgi:hypothetical protein
LKFLLVSKVNSITKEENIDAVLTILSQFKSKEWIKEHVLENFNPFIVKKKNEIELNWGHGHTIAHICIQQNMVQFVNEILIDKFGFDPDF